MTALARDRTVDTSRQVINLKSNTASKCVPHILGNLQLLQTEAKLCADAHYYFAHFFNSPWGSKAFQYVSGETRTYNLSHQGRSEVKCRAIQCATRIAEVLVRNEELEAGGGWDECHPPVWRVGHRTPSSQRQ